MNHFVHAKVVSLSVRVAYSKLSSAKTLRQHFIVNSLKLVLQCIDRYLTVMLTLIELYNKYNY